MRARVVQYDRAGLIITGICDASKFCHRPYTSPTVFDACKTLRVDWLVDPSDAGELLWGSIIYHNLSVSGDR